MTAVTQGEVSRSLVFGGSVPLCVSLPSEELPAGSDRSVEVYYVSLNKKDLQLAPCCSSSADVTNAPASIHAIDHRGGLVARVETVPVLMDLALSFRCDGRCKLQG